MKLKLPILIIVTCFTGSAFAKIGDSEAKWLTRFPGTRLIARDTYKGHKRMAVQFPDGGQVFGVFVNNSCEFQTSLTPRTKSREPSLSDVEKVADQYGGPLDLWAFLSPNENYKQWVRPDGQLQIVVQKESDGRWSLCTIAGTMLAEIKGSGSANVAQNSAPVPDKGLQPTLDTPELATMAKPTTTPTPEPTSTPDAYKGSGKTVTEQTSEATPLPVKPREVPSDGSDSSSTGIAETRPKSSAKIHDLNWKRTYRDQRERQTQTVEITRNGNTVTGTYQSVASLPAGDARQSVLDQDIHAFSGQVEEVNGTIYIKNIKFTDDQFDGSLFSWHTRGTSSCASPTFANWHTSEGVKWAIDEHLFYTTAHNGFQANQRHEGLIIVFQNDNDRIQRGAEPTFRVLLSLVHVDEPGAAPLTPMPPPRNIADTNPKIRDLNWKRTYQIENTVVEITRDGDKATGTYQVGQSVYKFFGQVENAGPSGVIIHHIQFTPSGIASTFSRRDDEGIRWTIMDTDPFAQNTSRPANRLQGYDNEGLSIAKVERTRRRQITFETVLSLMRIGDTSGQPIIGTWRFQPPASWPAGFSDEQKRYTSLSSLCRTQTAVPLTIVIKKDGTATVTADNGKSYVAYYNIDGASFHIWQQELVLDNIYKIISLTNTKFNIQEVSDHDDTEEWTKVTSDPVVTPKATPTPEH